MGKSLSLNIIILVILYFLITQCATTKSTAQKESNTPTVVYPSAPDTARIQFLTSINTTDDLPNKKKAAWKEFLTGEKETIFGISRPYGVSSTKGKILISDLNGGMVIIDLAKSKIELFNSEGTTRLVSPVNSSVDTAGNLFVADLGLNKIMIYDSNNDYIGSIESDFIPTSVFVKNNKIWVCNKDKKRVEVYHNDSTKSLAYTFPNNVTSDDPSYLFLPINLCVDDKYVYVSDFGGFHVNVFTHKGEHVKLIGQQGRGYGMFARNKGIAVDDEGNIFVVDAVFENVQIFNSNGELLLPFGFGKPAGNLFSPAGVAIDYDNLDYFKQYVDPKYKLKYLIYVISMFGNAKLNVYGRIELNQ